MDGNVKDDELRKTREPQVSMAYLIRQLVGFISWWWLGEH